MKIIISCVIFSSQVIIFRKSFLATLLPCVNLRGLDFMSGMTFKAFSLLREQSARLGADPWLIQGAGGNTSIKHDGIMWIKASGKWLMHAVEQEIFVPVKLQPVLNALDSGDPRAEKSIDFVVDKLNPQGLRPSIETTLHAVMKQRVVIHVHCVNTIALAIRKDAEQQIKERLVGFDWVFIPYIRPGLPLSRSIRSKLGTHTNVLVLGNHGLVVAADNVDKCIQLLERVRLALLSTPRKVIESSHVFAQTPNTAKALYQKDIQNTEQLPETKATSEATPAIPDPAHALLHSDYIPAEPEDAHAIAFDNSALNVASGGSLYPDHVIFLGDGTVVARANEGSEAIVARCQAAGLDKPVSIVFPGVGVAMKKDATPGQQAMARCLSDVCLRVPNNADISYLNRQQNHELLNWEAEQYRQTLNQL